LSGWLGTCCIAVLEASIITNQCREAAVTRQSRSTNVVAAAVIAAVGAIAAVMPARATPVSFLISGYIPPGEGTSFPVGDSGDVSVRLSYDPDLASRSSPSGGEFLLEESAKFSVQFGDLTIDVTGADGISAGVGGWGIGLRVPLPAGRLWFTPKPTWLLMELGENSSGPGPFEGLQHLPANLDVIRPRDSSVWLTTLEGESVHGSLFDIRQVPEPATIAILLVGLAGLVGMISCAGRQTLQDAR
jgi:hypothetical protein